MKVTHKHTQGDIGIAGVYRIMSGFGWLFREQPKSDLGVDAHVEITREGQSTGCLLGLQIKSGRSYLRKNSNGDFIFYFDREHRDYWLEYSLPVILILYDSSLETAYWQSLDRDTIKETSKARFKVIVPSTQMLNNPVDLASKYFDDILSLLIELRKKWLRHGLLPEPETLSYLSSKIELQKISRENLGFILCSTCAQRETIEEWSVNNKPFSYESLFYYLCGKNSFEVKPESISLGSGIGALGSSSFVDHKSKVMGCLLIDYKGEGLEIITETNEGFSTEIRHIPTGKLSKAHVQFEEKLISLLESVKQANSPND